MTKKMDVLFITSDQQHFNTIGAFNKEIKTPNLDRLVSTGTYFDHAYTVNPTCTPTRATFITGKYPSQHGAWTLGTKLLESEHTIGEDFIKNDYKTALVGKAHFQPLASTEEYPSLECCPIMQDLKFWENFNENFYGFQDVKLARNHTNEAHIGQHYALWMEKNGLANWRDFFLAPTGNLKPSNDLLWKIPEEFHYDAWIAEETNNKLEEYKKNDENFFLWASFFDPHPDYLVPEPWASMYDPETLTIPHIIEGEHDKNSPFHKLSQEVNPDVEKYKLTGYGLHGVHSHLHDKEFLKKQVATYYAMVSLMDKYIGKILDKLDELSLTENTLIVFSTDHGHFFGQHGLIAKGPFMYDDLIKVPLIAKLPNVIPANRVSHSMQSNVDFMQTMLDYCDIKAPDGVAGKSQKAVWNGEVESVRDYAICEHNHERDSVNVRTMITKKYKISVYINMECGDLFDLEADPNEINNLWDNPDYRDIKSQMLHKFVQAEMDREPKFMPRVTGA